MEIYYELNENYGLSLALGYFDGIHKGHVKVLNSAINYAKTNGTKSAVITFKEHPHCYFKGECPKYILQNREQKFEQIGIDYLYELDFNESLCKLTAHEYLENIIIKNFRPKSISTGFNHYFGINKCGDVKFLNENQKKYSYKYFEIPAQKYNNEIISSTSIRKYIQNGEIEQANAMLGYNFSIEGIIVEGQKLGRQLGYKTANVNYPEKLIDIPYGVYSVETNYGKGIANFGLHPTINNIKKPILETHIFDFDKNIYGENIKVEFKKMIRNEKKFTTLEELKNQIKNDIKSV